MIDFTRQPTRSEITMQLNSLVAGEHIMYLHTLKTPFSVWLSSKRKRLGKNFRASRVAPNGQKLPANMFCITLDFITQPSGEVLP